MLVDQHLQLASELNLLSRIGQNSLSCAIRESPALQWSQRRHILDNQNTQFIARLIEQLGLNFDLRTVLVCMFSGGNVDEYLRASEQC